MTSVFKISYHSSQHSVVCGYDSVMAVYIQLSQRTDIYLKLFFSRNIRSEIIVEGMYTFYNYRLVSSDGSFSLSKSLMTRNKVE